MTHPTTQPSGWTSDPTASPDGRPWDLLIIGGGTAGLVAAHTAAGFGATVLLVERDRTGGDCLWTGCVPSKALLAAAHAAAGARAAGALGVQVGPVEVDFAAVMRHVSSTIRTIEPVDAPAAVRASGAFVVNGSAHFTGPNSVEVDGKPVRFTQALLATGSAPVIPELPGLATMGMAAPLTSDTVWSLTQLPQRLLVLGGGAIGCELGQGLARLGARVTIVETADRLVPGETAAAASALRTAFLTDGIDVRTGVSVESVESVESDTADPAGRQESVALLSDGSVVAFDEILVAVGRRPRTHDLGLELAGVSLTDSGHVAVDPRLRTTNPRVWAAGDLTGQAPFTHTAGAHGSLAASNAVLGLRRTVQPNLVPRVTYTQPEIASFGVNPEDDTSGCTVHTIAHTEVDRAVAEGHTDGHSTLVFDRKGRVVGASIVGPRAGESLAEAVLAGAQGLRGRTIAGAMHAYPTWSDGVWKAGLAQARGELTSAPMRQVTGALVGLRRRWLGRRTR